MTLAYAFMLLFCGAFDCHVEPTLWPAMWMGVLVLVLFNPLPVFHHKSQFRLIQNWFRPQLPRSTTVEVSALSRATDTLD